MGRERDLFLLQQSYWQWQENWPQVSLYSPTSELNTPLTQRRMGQKRWLQKLVQFYFWTLQGLKASPSEMPATIKTRACKEPTSHANKQETTLHMKQKGPHHLAWLPVAVRRIPQTATPLSPRWTWSTQPPQGAHQPLPQRRYRCRRVCPESQQISGGVRTQCLQTDLSPNSPLPSQQTRVREHPACLRPSGTPATADVLMQMGGQNIW